MSALVIGVRAVHFAAVLLLFGTHVVALWIARPVIAEAKDAVSNELREVQRRLLRLGGWSLAGAIASGALWFVVQAAAMSGAALDSAFDRETLGTVLSATLFGRVSEIRLGLALALCAMLFVRQARRDDRNRFALSAVRTLLAGALLASLAWTGHAAAEQGLDRFIHLIADVVHLLAAGAWLGGLPALVLLLNPVRLAPSAVTLKLAERSIRRFSTLGLVSVGLLVLSGSANTWYAVGSVPALLGTTYGALLLMKICLFGAMVALAGVNRLRLTPQIRAASGNFSGGHEPSALLWLRRAAMTEFVIGLAIVIVIAALGTTIPARHGQPVWPLPFTFDWDLLDESASVRRLATVAGAGVVLGVVLATWGVRIRRWTLSMVGVIAAFASVAVVAERLRVPAHRTTYFRSPVPYSVTSIARGASLFAHDCAPCHGPQGRGDGPVAKSLAIKPANLTEHAFHHREGDLIWWVKQGIAGTPMPSFEGRLGDGEIWDAINFLRVLTQSEASKALNANVDPWRPIIAPDFTFQIARKAQESLKQQRGRAIVLLVFYSHEESLHRLQSLTASKPTLDRAGVRIVAMPINRSALSMENELLPGVDNSILARAEPESIATYLLFAPMARAEDATRSTHVEFLIDRQGYLRARWQPGLQGGWDQFSELDRQTEVLNREEPHAPDSEAHLH